MPVQPLQSHYFTVTGNGFMQTDAQKFGPIDVDNFSLTSKFTLAAEQKAFAICKGVVFVQPQGGNKVNLILRPYTQPIAGLNIKYFVYRGLKRTDFVNGTNVATDTTGASDFIVKINNDFRNFHGVNPPPFDAKFIGFDTTVPNTALIESFFFKESIIDEVTDAETSPFELPMIDMGLSLGNFAVGNCGIDVVLHYGDYKHEFDNGDFKFDLLYARSEAATITLAGTEPEKKLQREQITQFIDIAAFYGMFANDGKVITDTNGTKTEKIGVQIYNEVIAPFFTKNNWYLYLQSDRTRSYNYYGNYTIPTTNNSLKLGIEANTLTEMPFGTDGWPLLINSQSQTPGTPNDLKNRLYIQFVTDHNINTMLYSHVGTIEGSQQNFRNADELRQPADENGVFSSFTNLITLTTKAVTEGPVNKNIAGLSIILYQGMTYKYLAGQVPGENNSMVDVYATPNFFDDVFDLIKAKPLLVTGADESYSKMTSEKLNLINYYDGIQKGITAIQTVTVRDVISNDLANSEPLHRITFITNAVETISNEVYISRILSADTKTESAQNSNADENKTYALLPPFYHDLKIFTDGSKTITGLLIKSFNDSMPNKIILGLTKSEGDTLGNLINDNTKNPRLFLVDLFKYGNELISPEQTKYKKYKAGIVAEFNGVLTLLFPPASEEIIVYSLDYKYHFTKGYSDYMPQQIIETLTIDDNLVL